MHPDTEQWFNDIEREINDKRNSEFFSFIKQLLVLSTTLTGLALAFHKFVENDSANLYLILSVVLFLLNILLALIVLHGQIRNLALLRQKIVDKKQEMVENSGASTNIDVPFGKDVVLGAKILYVSFFLSVLSLCLYGITSINSSKEDMQQKQKTEMIHK